VSKSESVAPEGRPTHTPKIRIRGVEPGSEQHNALVDRYRGQLGQFHRKNQTQVRLGKHEQYASTKRIPGARMRYNNNQGHETITLEVDTIGEVGGEEVAAPENFWDYALIDMEFASVVTVLGGGIQSAVVQIAAQYESPKTSEQKAMTDATQMPVRGLTAQDWFNPPHPMIELGDWTVQDAPIVAVEATTSTRTTSLRVELKNYHGQVVRVGIYGNSTQSGVPVPFTLTAVCVRGGNPWTGLVKRAHTIDSEMDSYIFVVPSSYPVRPRMGPAGSGEIPVADYIPPDVANMPSRMFGLVKAGEVHIDTRSGSVKFKPA
jgi:hypothetical protein